MSEVTKEELEKRYDDVASRFNELQHEHSERLVRIAELERENAELKSRLESSKIVNSKMAEEFFDLKRTAEERLTRLRAVVRAARRPANLPALLQTLRALLPGDAEGE